MILGIDSSAISAGCALVEGGKIVAEEFLNTRHTHSETLLPMVSSMLKSTGVGLSDVERIAVTTGPGSFTGLRIGISAVKGLCMGAEKSCTAVSTLEAVAYNFLGIDSIICACMDARCRQVYNALFSSEGGVIKRMCDDRAVSLEELSEELTEVQARIGRRIFLAGDGAEIADKFTEGRFSLAPPSLRFQRGAGVCLAAQNLPDIKPEALMPTYLRLPQAERERLARVNSQL